MLVKKINSSPQTIDDFSTSIAKTNIDPQRASHSHFENRHNQLINLTTKILKTSDNQGIHPRYFCRRWFELEAINEYGRPRFTEGQILAMESEHGYREKCINLIARLLKIKPNTIHRWEKGVAFDKIPVDKRQNYELYLGYVDTIRIITASLKEIDENSLLRVLRRLEVGHCQDKTSKVDDNTSC